MPLPSVRFTIGWLLLFVALIAVPLSGWMECARRKTEAASRAAVISAERQAKARTPLPTPAFPVMPY
jgi:hypothetical protein